MTYLRPTLMFCTAALVATGVLPDTATEYMEANADAIIAGLIGVWGLVALIRNRKEARHAAE
jgi:hypothetical protein